MQSTSMFIAGALVAGAATQTFTGVITDAMCGKDHALMKVTPDSKCVRVGDRKTPEQFAGQTVKITGTRYEKTEILPPDSIRTAGQPATERATSQKRQPLR